MKFIRLFFLYWWMFPAPVFAQDRYEQSEEKKRTFMKLNIPGLAFRNYSFQLEHTVGKRLSLALGYREMPAGPLPMQRQVAIYVGSAYEETNRTIGQLRTRNRAITPELRWYVGKKGFGQGFYLAPFYRYAMFDATNVTVDYTNGSGAKSTMSISGAVTTHSMGLLLGAQWRMGRWLSVDWWMMGPHYGQASGTLQGAPSIPLTGDEQQRLRQEMESVEVPFTSRRVEVSDTYARYIMNGPWAGVRTGLCLGIHF